jgi:hypothetical protein
MLAEEYSPPIATQRAETLAEQECRSAYRLKKGLQGLARCRIRQTATKTANTGTDCGTVSRRRLRLRLIDFSLGSRRERRMN